MTTTILAHFDGKVFVPDEPVDIPIGTPLRVRVETVSPAPTSTAGSMLTPVIVGLDAADAQSIASEPTFDAENM